MKVVPVAVPICTPERRTAYEVAPATAGQLSVNPNGPEGATVTEDGAGGGMVTTMGPASMLSRAPFSALTRISDVVPGAR